MRMFDYSPLFRSSIGFDRVFNLLEAASRDGTSDSWPPYDIIKQGEDQYRVTLAVAGFTQDDLTITNEANLLVVKGAKTGTDEVEYLHRGIAGRSFERRFELADHVKVTGASLLNGLLTIELVREIPEDMKPRKIAILSHAPQDSPRQIEGSRKAA